MRFNPRDISKNIITGSTVQIFTFNLEHDFFLNDKWHNKLAKNCKYDYILKIQSYLDLSTFVLPGTALMFWLFFWIAVLRLSFTICKSITLIWTH